MEEQLTFSNFVNYDDCLENLKNYEKIKRDFAFEIIIDQIELFLKHYSKWEKENNLENKICKLLILANEQLELSKLFTDFLLEYYNDLNEDEQTKIRYYCNELDKIKLECKNFNEEMIKKYSKPEEQ